MRAARWTSRGSGWMVHGWARLELLGGTYEYASETPSNKIPSPGTKKKKTALTAATLCFRDRCCIPPEDEFNEMAASEVAGSPAGSPLPDSRLAGWRQLVATLLSVVARSARLGVWAFVGGGQY